MWSRRTREYRLRVQLLFAYCEAIVQKCCLLFKSLCKYNIIASMLSNTGLVVCSWLHYLELAKFWIACHLDLAHAWNRCPLEIMFFQTYVCLYLLLHGVVCVSNMTSLFKSKSMKANAWHRCHLELVFFLTYVCLYIMFHGVACVSNMTYFV